MSSFPADGPRHPLGPVSLAAPDAGAARVALQGPALCCPRVAGLGS